MRASVSFTIGDWTHTVSVESATSPEAVVRNLFAPGTLLTDVIDERFGAHPNTRRRLDEIALAR